MGRVSSGVDQKKKKKVLGLMKESAAITKAREVCLHRVMTVGNGGLWSPSTIRGWKFLNFPLGFSSL